MFDFLKHTENPKPSQAHCDFVREEVDEIIQGLHSTDPGKKKLAEQKINEHRSKWGGETQTGKTFGQSGEILTRLLAENEIDEIII